MNWKEKVNEARRRRALLCIGLDTDMEKFPEDMRKGDLPQFERNRELIDATGHLAAAFKLNQAFYEVEGPRGCEALERTVAYIKKEHPEILIILDAKKGDIGNTSRAYSKAAFDRIGVDSITVNAYMGKDAVTPFSDREDKLVFVLCRTSNSAATEVQDTPCPLDPLFMRMATLVDTWNSNGNLGVVVGATFPDEIRKVRERVGYEMPLLIPGIGTQGGDLKKVLEMGTSHETSALLINVSRGIMYSFLKEEGSDYIGSAVEAAERYSSSIRKEMEYLGRW
ncbi:MAG: orotidine-5'-phosphate decarboxylase [Candidatus Thermoplasmatota archaeon]|nr:orotidine-5'-phosphate decarboxylase [Candidatus Thermoplasmatota archaeon]